MDPKAIRLTQTVKKGGCAAKLPAGQLREILGSLSLKPSAQLKVGTENLDDACLWDLGDGRYLVQTLDFFTPIVDDASDFGAIAAANALSDVYAMGGTPGIALTILAFPTATLPLELLQPLMSGAVQKIQESGASLGGGHSIDDETLKLGFSVTGFVDRERAWTNAGAKPGDALILTKALGTGVLTTAMKEGDLTPEHARIAIESMKLLNRAPELLTAHTVRAATDITGFGLAGHAMQMAQASGVTFQIRLKDVPALPGALEFIRDGYLNRAHKTNRDYVAADASYAEALEEEWRHLSCDAQTSGGLLLSVPGSSAESVVGILRHRFPETRIVGHAVARATHSLQFV